MLRVVFLLSAFAGFCSMAHVIIQPALVQPVQHHQSIAHPAVVESQFYEHQLPSELTKSAQFYSNPKTAARLIQESWLTDKEHPVFDREAEKIERSQISKIFVNSGLHRRRRQV